MAAEDIMYLRTSAVWHIIVAVNEVFSIYMVFICSVPILIAHSHTHYNPNDHFVLFYLSCLYLQHLKFVILSKINAHESLQLLSVLYFFFPENLSFLSWEHKSKSITTKALKIILRSEILGSPPMDGGYTNDGWVLIGWELGLPFKSTPFLKGLFLFTNLKDFKSFWIRFYSLFQIWWVSGKIWGSLLLSFFFSLLYDHLWIL